MKKSFLVISGTVLAIGIFWWISRDPNSSRRFEIQTKVFRFRHFVENLFYDSCVHVSKQDRSLCRSNPLELIRKGRGKSSSLKQIRLSSQPASNHEEVVFHGGGQIWETKIPIPWGVDPFHSRSWKMSLEAWRILDGYMAEYEKSKDKEYIGRIFSILHDWYRFHIRKLKPSEFAWNDMATAFRTDRLSKIMDWISHDGTIASKDDLFLIIDLADLHADYLSDPEFLSQDNHGVFSITSLARLCKVAPYLQKCSNIEAWIEKTMETLIRNQFGSDGLQLEHSFFYHSWMGDIFDSIIEENIVPLSQESLNRIQKAELVEHWLRDPLGNLVPVGDTAPKQKKRVDQNQFSKNNTMLFPEGGLAVVRTPNAGLWFYGFHHSSSHKHDDDLAFYLWDKDQPILIDGGKYKYNNDEKRKYVYSRQAHNTVVVPDLDHERRGLKPYGSGILSLEQISGSYLARGKVEYEKSVQHERTLEFTPGQSLLVHDNLSGYSGNFEIHYLLAPQLDKISETPSKVVFASKTVNVSIEMNNQQCRSKTYKGFTEENKMRGWYTRSPGKLSPTWSLTFTCPASQKVTTTISYASTN